MIVAFTKNELKDGTKRKLSEYSNDLETRIDENIGVDFIVARGKNYLKFNSGMLIQWGIFENTATGSTYNIDLYQPYNTGFGYAPSLVFNWATSATLSAVIEGQTSSQIKVRIVRSDTGDLITGIQRIYWQTIGSWK